MNTLVIPLWTYILQDTSNTGLRRTKTDLLDTTCTRNRNHHLSAPPGTLHKILRLMRRNRRGTAYIRFRQSMKTQQGTTCTPLLTRPSPFQLDMDYNSQNPVTRCPFLDHREDMNLHLRISCFEDTVNNHFLKKMSTRQDMACSSLLFHHYMSRVDKGHTQNSLGTESGLLDNL